MEHRLSLLIGLSLCFYRHSDATGERFYHIVGPLLVGILGFVIAISTMNTAARYIALYVFCLILLPRHLAHLFPQLPHGLLLQRLRHLLRLVLQLLTPPTRKARRRHRIHQRILPARQHRRLVHLALKLGAIVPQLVCNLHCDEWSEYCDVRFLQRTFEETEHEAREGGAGEGDYGERI